MCPIYIQLDLNVAIVQVMAKPQFYDPREMLARLWQYRDAQRVVQRILQ